MKITLTKVSNANVYMHKQLYISFKIILNKRLLVSKTQGLYCHELITGAQPVIFQGGTGFMEQQHFDKDFMHDIQKKGCPGKNFIVFLQDILKTAFQVRI